MNSKKYKITFVALAIFAIAFFGLANVNFKKNCKSTWAPCSVNSENVCYRIEDSCKDSEISINMGGSMKGPYVHSVSLYDTKIKKVIKSIVRENMNFINGGYRCYRNVWSANYSSFDDVTENCDDHPDYRRLIDAKDSVSTKTNPDGKYLYAEYSFLYNLL